MTSLEETERQEMVEESDTSGDNSNLSDYLERAWLEETGCNNDESGDDTEEIPDDDQTLPPGWRISYQDLSPRIVSKSGEVFSSRREAFQWLCSEDRAVEERAEMFDKLVHEDFQASDGLPLGWVFHPAEGEIGFLSSEGLYLSSVREAERYFKAQSQSEEYEQFQQFLSGLEERPQFVSREGQRMDSAAEDSGLISRNSPPYGVREGSKISPL